MTEEVKREYLQKLEKIRKGKFIRINDFANWYRLLEPSSIAKF